jgi:iron-sulfur cluster-binding protein
VHFAEGAYGKAGSLEICWNKNGRLRKRAVILPGKIGIWVAISNGTLYNGTVEKKRRRLAMKKVSVKKGAACMACLECVRACSQAFYKEFHQDKACIQVVEKNGAPKPLTCIQCGKCAKACEAGAITQNPKTGVYMINKKLCTGCGKCAEVCPFHVIVPPAVSGGTASKCIACGICVKSCPMEILEIVEK